MELCYLHPNKKNNNSHKYTDAVNFQWHCDTTISWSLVVNLRPQLHPFRYKSLKAHASNKDQFH